VTTQTITAGGGEERVEEDSRFAGGGSGEDGDEPRSIRPKEGRGEGQGSACEARATAAAGGTGGY
jgi:hypothetical protein